METAVRTIAGAPAVARVRRGTCWTLALLPNEPAGVIPTRTAGLVEVRATLHWQPGRVPREPILPASPNDGRVRCSFMEESDETADSRIVIGEIRAFTEPDLSRTLEAVLRSISATAAVSEAVLEARAFRSSSPKLTRVSVLETLARDLRGAGFPVEFGRSWSPAPDAEVAVGIDGAGEALLDFLDRHPSWETTA